MKRNKHKLKNIDIGKCIKIINCEKNYQVIGLNPKIDVCWVREWPLNFSRYQTFELSINQITISSSCGLKTK